MPLPDACCCHFLLQGGEFASIMFMGDKSYSDVFAQISDDSFLVSDVGLPPEAWSPINLQEVPAMPACDACLRCLPAC